MLRLRQFVDLDIGLPDLVYTSWVVAVADTIIQFASTYPLYLRAAERDPAAATERILNRIFGFSKDPLREDSSRGPASPRGANVGRRICRVNKLRRHC
jgi:hypothetical protein